MKNRIIPILVSCFVILTSLSSCKEYDPFNRTIENPVSVTIDGAIYKSHPERIYSVGGDVHSLVERDGGFNFYLARAISSDKKTYTLYLDVTSTEPFELGRRYKFSESCSIMSISDDDGKWTYHYAETGWVEFTDFSKDSHCYVSGIFEMDVADYDESPMELRDGRFGPLRIYYDYFNE